MLFLLALRLVGGAPWPAAIPGTQKPPPGGRTSGDGFAYWRRANVASDDRAWLTAELVELVLDGIEARYGVAAPSRAGS